MPTIRNVGALTDLADGSILAPGQSKRISAEQMKDPHNQQLLDENRIAVVQEEPKREKGGDK
jgi:hypothetical protein